MEVTAIARQFAGIDDLDLWSEVASGLDRSQKQAAIQAAQPLWIERMVKEGKLLLHPEVIDTLSRSHWRPQDNHLQMIWASLLASRDSTDSKEYFQRIKKKLLRKYGRDWWEAVYKRVNHAYAAKARIARNIGDLGPGMHTMAKRSIFIGSIVADEYRAALEMIPKD